MGKVLGTLSLWLLLVTILCELLSPLIVMLFAPGFWHDPTRLHLATQMMWLTLPYMFLVTIAAFLSAILNSRGFFAVSAFTPVFLNVVMIIAAVSVARYFTVPEMALALGVFLAGLVQLFFQVPYLRRHKLLPTLQWGWGDPEVRSYLKRLLPLLLGASVTQIGLLITTLFASFLKVGSISWLFYADRLAFFPLGVLSVALATAVLPTLTTCHLRNETRGFNEALDWALRLLLIMGLPATVGLLLMSGPLTVSLFKHGKFSLVDTAMTINCIKAFSIGLLGFMATKILTSAFYAQQNVKFPMKAAIITIVSNIVFCALFMIPWAHVGLALATSVAAIMNAVLLLGMLLRYQHFKPLPGWSPFLLKMLFANGVLVVFLLTVVPGFTAWLQWNSYQQIAHLIIYLIGSVLLYFCSLWLSGMRPAHLQLLNVN
jgi:putative peptidoglycan lipid II flippase